MSILHCRIIYDLSIHSLTKYFYSQSVQIIQRYFAKNRQFQIKSFLKFWIFKILQRFWDHPYLVSILAAIAGIRWVKIVNRLVCTQWTFPKRSLVASILGCWITTKAQIFVYINFKYRAAVRPVDWYSTECTVLQGKSYLARLSR